MLTCAERTSSLFREEKKRNETRMKKKQKTSFADTRVGAGIEDNAKLRKIVHE